MTREQYELIDHVLGGNATAEQRDEFAALVLADDEFALAAARHAAMIAEVHERFAGALVVDTEPAHTAPKPRAAAQRGPGVNRTTPYIAYALAAALVMAAAVVAMYVLVQDAEPDAPDPPRPPVATLIESTPGSTLTTPGGFISEGRDYPQGEYALDRGMAEFMLTNAVNVKLRGETRMHMHNDLSVSLASGSAEFVVPSDATGFTVHLPNGARVVDLGTRFDIDLDDAGAVRVRVSEGAVELHRVGSEPIAATTGQALWVDPDGRTLSRTTTNLIVNGDAEADEGGIDSSDRSISGWTDETGATVIRYDSPYVLIDNSPGPPLDSRGENFFSGGRVSDSRISQTIDVSEWADRIDTGRIRFELSGWLGGYSNQNDRCRLTAHFLDADGRAADSEIASIGPVTRWDRGDRTALLYREALGAVPPGTRQVRVVLENVREIGTGSADGYADNLSLILIMGTALNSENTSERSGDTREPVVPAPANEPADR